MSQSLRAFTHLPIPADDPLMSLLARHTALAILPMEDVLDCLGLDPRQADALVASGGFKRLLASEKARLLTLDGRRDMADWKQCLVEHQYLERLMVVALDAKTTAPVVVDAYKNVRRPQEKVAAGAGGGPTFAIQINVPGAAPTSMHVPMPVIDASAEEEA